MVSGLGRAAPLSNWLIAAGVTPRFAGELRLAEPRQFAGGTKPCPFERLRAHRFLSLILLPSWRITKAVEHLDGTLRGKTLRFYCRTSRGNKCCDIK